MNLQGTDIQKARSILTAEGLVAIPTETVYGLAGNGLSNVAITRIFEAKNRPFFDPLILHIGDISQVTSLVITIPAPLQKLMETFWPGPLTVLLPKSQVVPDLVTSGQDRVALRIPQHPLTLSLLLSLDFPLAAPSANPFGYVSPTTAQHVADQLGDQVDYILDGGSCSIGLESTIVGMEGDAIVVYRKGGLAIEEIEKLVGPIQLTDISTSKPAAPGMLIKHYAPSKSVHWKQDWDGPWDETVGILGFQHLHPQLPAQNQLLLSPTGDLREAAYHLFAFLREMDRWPVQHILVEKVPDIGLGKAINDKLTRATASRTKTN